MHNSGYRNLPFIVVILGLFLATGAEVFYHAGSGIVTGYSHLYYLVVIIAAYYFRYWAVIVGAYLGVIHYGIEITLTGSVAADAALRAISLIAAGIVSAFLASALRTHVPVKEVIENSMYRVRAMMVNEADIVKMRKSGDLPGLLSLLAHGEMDQRYAAIDALGLLRDPRAIELLIETTRSDTYSGLRWKAAEALARIGRPAVGPLISLLDDPDEDVRWKVAIALGEIGDQRAISPLISLLADPDSYVRSRAALALGAIGDRATPDLIRSLTSVDPAVRSSAASALGIIGTEEVIPLLIPLLFDPVDQVKAEAAAALAKIGPSALPLIVDAVKSAPSDARCKLFSDLGAVEPLLEIIREGGAEIRLECAFMLKELGDPSLSLVIEELGGE
ncbi:HEAT repeat domain-containing protein [Methanocalculus sp.]|uniref:HEAT repeat domain-containing protein n=1 Tax=Methanocalculus sp. TaxID=2004547 RepID=UPI002724A891|nr:HEAT repeat domain-containing protein [Methanocalculus sp.]MDO8842497.1 HEAT repeat domain-containing protein [Methanocalculus sp.]